VAEAADVSAAAGIYARQLWHDHSLTIVLTAIGLAFLALAHTSEDDRFWDFWLGLFHAAIGVALLNLLAGPFRERNRPEK
jgi:hypothetical protein